MGEPDLSSNAPLARPTSAPPVLEISRASLFAFTDTRADLNRIFTDIRCDENYPSFYEDFQQANGEVVILPPPLEAPIVPSSSGLGRPAVAEQVQPTPQRLSAQGFLPPWTPFQAATEYDWQQDLRRNDNPVSKQRTSGPGSHDTAPTSAPVQLAHVVAYPSRAAPLPAPAALPHLVRPVAPAPLIPIPSSNGMASRSAALSPHGGSGLSRKLEQLSLEDFGLEEAPLPDFSSDSDGAALSSTDDLNGSSPHLPSIMDVAPAFPNTGMLFGRVEREVRRIWDDPPATVVVPAIRTSAPTEPVLPSPSTPPIDSRETCRYYQQGFCSRGERCQFLHAMQPPAIIPPEQSHRRTPTPPEHTTSPAPGKRNSGKNRHMNGASANGNGKGGSRSRKGEEIHRARSPPAPPAPIVPVVAAATSPTASPGNASADAGITAGFTSIDQALGGIYALCKDQHGCRFLQKQIEERIPRVLDAIFAEVYPHFVELMTDPFGNYLCQKLLECCPERQRVALIESVSPHLVAISHNMHGTRAVQKMIEFLSTPQMVALVVAGLRANVVALIQDLNGNHVIQRCLQRLTPPDNQFIYDAVSAHCVQVATHRHGCCVLQRCIDYASESQKRQLMSEVIRNAHTLVRDAFGNYVVQYVMDLPYPDVGNQLARRFQGHVADLSTQKFSSNVIEKCLKAADRPTLNSMITELTDGESLPMLLQDPYGNYVVQTALSLADPETHRRMVALIRPHLPAIRNTPYGKRIQNKITKESKSTNGSNNGHAHHGGGGSGGSERGGGGGGHGHRKR